MALSCTVFDIFDIEEYCNLEIRIIGLSRSSILVPFDSLSVVSYQRPIVTLSLNCTVSEIFALEMYCDLEIRVSGHSR